MSNQEDTNVLALHAFDDVDARDLKSGIMAYLTVAGQISGLQSSVATWQFDVIKAIWEDEDKIPSLTLKAYTTRMTKVVEDNSDVDMLKALGLTPAAMKLTGRDGLAAPYKKIVNYLEKGLSIDDVTSVSAMAIKTADTNKAEKKADDNQRAQSEIAEMARKRVTDDGVDPDSDEGKVLVKAFIADKIKRLNAEEGVTNKDADTSKPDLANTYVDVLRSEFGLAVPDHLKSHTALIVERMTQLTAEAVNLLINKSLVMNGADDAAKADAAYDQLMVGIESQAKKWIDTAAGHRKLAIDNGFIVVDDDEEIELQEVAS